MASGEYFKIGVIVKQSILHTMKSKQFSTETLNSFRIKNGKR